MAFDGEPSDFKSTAEKDASAVFDGESLFENLEAADGNQEKEFSLDSAEAIQSLLEYVEDTALDNWIDKHPVDWSSFSDTESYQLLAELQHEAKILEDKIETGEVSDVDAIVLQALIDEFQEHESPDVVENSIEEESFDVETYVNEQFSESSGLAASSITPVYTLLQEYKRAVEKEKVGDAEMLAQQIKDHVDELVGNNTIAQEGFGANLELQGRRRGDLEVEELDSQEPDLGRRIFAGVDKISPSENNAKTEAIATELYGMQLPTADDARDDLLREITPEEQLKKDLAEYGVEDLEPQLAAEAYVEPDKSEEVEVRAAPTSFAPAAVQEDQPSREAAREAREYKKKFEDKIKGIEHLDSGGFFSRLVNAGQSPYEVLADMNFEDIVLSSQPPYADSFNRSNYIKGLNVDHSAFENWMKLLPEIDDFSIETNGRTFKEVTDDLIEAQLKEGNTQST
jgi:hypothetical protein